MGPHAVGLAGRGGEGRLLALAGARCPHRADGADGALDAGGEFAHLDLLLRRRLADATAEGHDPQDRHAENDHDGAEQQRVDERHGDDGADEDQGVADRVREALREHGVQEGGVGAHARDEVAGAARVELADRQVEDARDEPPPARVDHRGAGALQEVVLIAGDDRRHDHERDDRPHEHPERLLGLHRLDDLPDQHRLRERGDGAEDAEDRDDDEHGAVLQEEGQQLPHARARPVVRGTPAESGAGGAGVSGHAGTSEQGMTVVFDRTSLRTATVTPR